MHLNQSLINFIKTTRLINLLFLALAQFLVAHYFVKEFEVYQLVLLSTSTLFIACAGYLFNDVADIPIDTFNGKLKAINVTNKGKFIKLASILLFVGLVLASLLCYWVGFQFLLYFLMAAFSLIFYAFYLSKIKIISNFLISGLIALAILLAYYLLRDGSYLQLKYSQYNEYSLWIYAALAFVFNWFREVVKDIEDLEGDLKEKRISLASLIGIRPSAFGVAFFLLIFALFFGFEFYLLQNMYLIPLSLTCLLASIQLFRAKEIKDFAQSSMILKIVLFLGLLSPIAFL